MEEVKRLAETDCKYPQLKRAFLFGCLTGLRKSDIMKLTWGEVQKFGEYSRLVFKQKKTGGQEYLDIPKSAEKYLGDRGNAKSIDLVFPLFRYSSETSLELRRWALAAGISKDFTFHCSRHTFAVLLLNSDTDIYTVSKLLGHRELGTTQIYAHLIDKKKQDAVSRISEIFEG
jgi:integrase